MAAKPKPKAKGKAKVETRKPANRLLMLVILMALVPFSIPTLLVLFFGMLPTLGAAITERGNNRWAWVCVGGLNFAGLSYWMLGMWFGHHTIEHAIGLVLNVQMYLVAYGAAGVAWLLYLALPPVVGTFAAMSSQRRAGTVSSSRKKLVDQWGDGITT